MGLFGQNMKKLKILKLSRDSRYLQKLALKCYVRTSKRMTLQIQRNQPFLNILQ